MSDFFSRDTTPGAGFSESGETPASLVENGRKKKEKRVLRPVSDEEFRVAAADPNNLAIIRSVARRYSRVLSRDELETCGLTALWRALANHDPSYNRKFTSSLWVFVKWECDKEVRRVVAARRGFVGSSSDAEELVGDASGARGGDPRSRRRAILEGRRRRGKVRGSHENSGWPDGGRDSTRRRSDSDEREERRLKEDLVHLGECMEKLDPRERRMIRLYWIEQYTLEEIGALESMAKESVRQRLETALARLREYWGPSSEEEENDTGRRRMTEWLTALADVVYTVSA